MFTDLRREEYRHHYPQYDLYHHSHDVVAEDQDASPTSSSHVPYSTQRLLYGPPFQSSSSAAYDCPDCTNSFYADYQTYQQDSSFECLSTEDGVADGTLDSASPTTKKAASRKKSLSQDELERRRSVANHQERRRMHRLNSALDLLRSVIPSQFQNGNHRRLSKIKTLKMAIRYISELQKVLGRPVVA